VRRPRSRRGPDRHKAYADKRLFDLLMPRNALLVLICLALVAPAMAAPLWTHNATGPVRDCAVSSDGKVIAISADLVHLFDRKGALVATTWDANEIALGPKGSLLAAATDDGVRAVMKNGTDLWSSPNRSVAVAVSGDGKTVAGLTPAGLLMIFGSTGARVGTADTGATGDALDLAASENASVIVSTDGGGVRAFTRKGAERWSVELANPSALAMNASGDLVAVGDGGSVKFYNLTGERVGRYQTAGRVRALAMTPSANLTVAGVEDGTVAALGPQGGLLWNLSAGARVNRVAVSSSGALVAVGSADRRLSLLAGNGTPLWDAPLAGEPVSLALSADGTTVAVGTDEGTAYVFDSGGKPAATATKAANGTAANATPARNASGAAVNGTARSPTAPTANGTAAGNRTAVATATRSPNATATTPLQLVIPNGTAKAGLPPALPAAALLLLGAWGGLRRRR
jgi:WD40 repeat protein